MKIPVKWNTKNKFCVATIHYSVDPEKNQDWLEKVKAGTPESTWQREYEIAYDVFEGKPVFSDFSQMNHVANFDYKPGEVEYLYRGWDFGYHHPACVIGWMGKDGVLYIRNAIMGENEYIKEFGTKIRNFCWNNFPNAKWLDACDPAGSQKKDIPDTSIEVLNELNIYPVYRKSLINEGIEIIRQRLERRNDGKFGIQVHPECNLLIDGLKGGYRYPDSYTGRADKEMPLKDGYYDHLCLVGNTFILTANGHVPIKYIKRGDLVATRNGFRPVEKSWMTSQSAETIEVTFSNGRKLRGTANHPIWINGKGWVAMDSVRYGDIINSCEGLTDLNINQSRLFLTGKDITDTQIHRRESSDLTTQEQVVKGYTLQYGKKKMARFLKDTTFTIKMATHLIMSLATSSALSLVNIFLNTCVNAYQILTNSKNNKNTVIESGHSPKNGTGQKKEESGTQSMVKKCLAIFQCLPGPVSSVKKNTKQKNDQGLGSVVTTANQHKDEKMAQTWKSELVSSAQLLMRLTSIQAKKLVGQKPVYVVSVQKREKAPVYNLTVQDQHEYYANGVLTHNCDATRYMVINFLDIMQTRTNSNVSAQNTILGRGSDSLASFSQDMGL